MAVVAPYNLVADALGLPDDAVARQHLQQLTGMIDGDFRWEDPRHVAYFLATTYHETAHSFRPRVEIGKREYFNRYEGKKNLGNYIAGDGFRFRGRGYVQITGRRNYDLFAELLSLPLLVNPDLACDPKVAYEIATFGMVRGLFTGKKIRDYIHDSECSYVEARRVINGLDKAELIAEYARKIEPFMRAAA